MTPRPARWLRPLVGVVVAALFVWLLATRVEWGAVRRVLVAASPGPLVLGLGLFGAGIAVRVVRWWWMLRAFEPRLAPWRCARPYLVSLALNNTMPLRAGDLVRTFGFRGELRAPPGRVLGTLVIERVLDLLVLLAVFFVGLLGAASGVVPRAYVTAGAVAGAAAVGAIAGAVLAVAAAAVMAVTGMAESGISVGGTALGVVLAVVVSVVAAVATSLVPTWRAASRPPIRSLTAGA